jgi:hypothetical protein
MRRLRAALATFAALGMGAACGYGGGASGTDVDGGVASEAGIASDAPSSGDSGVDAEIEAGADGGLSLSVAQSMPLAQVDLEAEGTLGWIHWGVTHMDHEHASKGSAPAAIPLFVVPPSNDLTSFDDNMTTFAWSNGAPPYPSGTDNDGVFLQNTSPATFGLTIPATLEPRRLVLYAGVYEAVAQLTVTLDGMTANVPAFDVQGHGYVRYAIDFSAPAGNDLQITWAMTNAYFLGNITLSAATLAPMP